MARRYTELVRAYGEPMDISTLAHAGSEATSTFLGNVVYRQPFALATSKRATSQARWARWLVNRAGSVDVLHCGEIRPVGYAVGWAHIRTRIPYVLYVNGGDLLREQEKTTRSLSKRISGRYLLENAAGIVANSSWTGSLTRDLMETLSIKAPPTVAEIDLGTDPVQFHPSRDKGRLRSRWGVAQAPLMITVARLVPHKGQDMGIEALARLHGEFPDLRYVLVGTGQDESRLRALAAQRGVSDRVISPARYRTMSCPRRTLRRPSTSVSPASTRESTSKGSEYLSWKHPRVGYQSSRVIRAAYDQLCGMGKQDGSSIRLIFPRWSSIFPLYCARGNCATRLEEPGGKLWNRTITGIAWVARPEIS